MNYELDDPRLTAYALGELDDAEKAAIEAFLNENEAVRDEVARIREAAQWLTAELGAEAPEGLSELERARILDQAKTAKPARKVHWGRWAVAALVLLVGGGAWMATSTMNYYHEKSAQATMECDVVNHAKAVNLQKLPISGAEGGSVSANAPKAEAHDLALAKKAPADASNTKAALTEKDFATVQHAKVVPLPASPSRAMSAPVPASAPVQAARPSDSWNTISTKTMSQQAVIGDAEPVQRVTTANAPASAAPPAEAKEQLALRNKESVNAPTGANQSNFWGRSYDASKLSFAPTSQSAPPPPGSQASPPAEVKEQLEALGYGDIRVDAPATAQPAPGKPKSAEATQNVQAYSQPVPPALPTPVPGSESYPALPENTFQRVADAPLSTFGMDVDTASYANVRRFLSQGTLPPGEAVRIEELVNYFKYDYPKPESDAPFSVTVDAHPCPWAPTHTLARIGLHGRELDTETRPPANLVFLIDVSGSMEDADKLPLLKKGMKLLAQTVTAKDRVSIVTYASGTGVALYPTPGDNKAAIESIIDHLQAGGSTNGEGGIQAAYDLARRAFIQGGVNRVILATDGDFNVGISDTGTLVSMIEQQAKTGVALSVLGFGQGNLKDERMMKLADKGNGNYAYIDSFNEARKVLLEQAMGTLFTIAKDVKIQVEFNPAKVGAYRLIGYEKRMLAAQDFNDDRKDAGEIGAGHTVTALYELVPPGEQVSPPQTDPLKYQTNAASAPAPPASDSPEMMTVKLRFKPPTGDVSTRFDVPIPATVVTAETRPDFQFASAVAAFGMLLRHSSYAGTATMDMVINLAQQGKGTDTEGLRAEFINLAKTASALMGTPKQ